MLTYIAIALFLIVCAVLFVRRLTFDRHSAIPDWLVGRWHIAGGERFVTFCKGNAGYFETEDGLETFSVVVKGDRMTIVQNCAERRYRIVRMGGELRLESRKEKVMLLRKQRSQKRP